MFLMGNLPMKFAELRRRPLALDEFDDGAGLLTERAIFHSGIVNNLHLTFTALILSPLVVPHFPEECVAVRDVPNVDRETGKLNGSVREKFEEGVNIISR